MSHSRARAVRVAATLAVTGLATAYILWRIDLRRTGHVLAHASIGWWLASCAIWVAAVWPLSWRWRKLLASSGVHERLGWLVRTTFVSYAAAQVLPTSLGGDASRIYETARRHPGFGGPVAGTIILERALGGAATLVLAVAGLALAVGQYSVGGYVWVLLAFVVLSVAGAFVLFSTRLHPLLHRLRPLLHRLRVESVLRDVYLALHAYRTRLRLLGWAFALTVAVQAVRVLAIWCAGKAVGIDLSPRPYYVMGPLLFLVMLVPFTINGLAVRESFFVSFLGTLGVSADQAFAAGFLFFVVTLVVALPGAAIVAWEGLRTRALPGAGAAR
ncbi:MAG TPA: lysylphosphatidylglycerol synthase transmembrane domain-containing protein [Gaiellaceae bacterium]|nr:lysylphosphatidylglycerol synthase transmembrane domain-containing protein [Gaiellaceae bacterium]